MDRDNEDPDVEIEVIDESPPFLAETNSFSDWSVILTILAASLLVLLVIFLMKRSERRRRLQPRESRSEGWIESSEEPDLDDLRSRRITSFNTRRETSDSPQGVEVVGCGLPNPSSGVSWRPNSNFKTKPPIQASAPGPPKDAIVEMKPDPVPDPRPKPLNHTQKFSLKSHPREVTLPLCPTSGLPCISPLNSIEELHFWHSGRDPWNVATIPLQVSERHKDSGEPRTMVCHDMMGGYQYDKYPQGHWESRNYCFYHWAYIDSFVYFSHKYVNLTQILLYFIHFSFSQNWNTYNIHVFFLR